jgi:hypothetical protein
MLRIDEASIDTARRRLLQALAQAATLGATPALAQGPWWGDRPVRPLPGKSIVLLDGEARVNGQPASLETRLRPGDEIEVGGGARLVAVIGSEAVMLRERTRLHLPSAAKSFFRLVQGGMLAVFGPREAPYEMQTPMATLGIRGTGLYAVAEPGRDYLCTCYGTVEIASQEDPRVRETIVSVHHDAPRYLEAGRDGAPPRLIPAPFVDHTDAELVLLEALVGREVPFGVPGAYERPRRDY